MIVYCPLSYSITDKDYVKNVIEYGQQIFGDRFVPITEYQQPETYFNFLADMDVFVMNNQRQRGMGILRTALFWGKVIYMSNENMNFHHFKSEGLILFETEMLSHEPIISKLTDNQKALNVHKMSENHDENKAVELWLAALNN
jgi:hypothetical protein